MNLRTLIACLLSTIYTTSNAEILFDLDHVEIVRLRQKNRLLDWSNSESNLLGLADVTSIQISYDEGKEKRTQRHYWSWRNDSYESTDCKLTEQNDGLSTSFEADGSRLKLILKNNSQNAFLIKIDTLSIVFRTPFTPDEIVNLNNEVFDKVYTMGPKQSDTLYFKTTKGQDVINKNIYGGTDFSFAFSGFVCQGNPVKEIAKLQEATQLAPNAYNEVYKTLQNSENNMFIGFEATYYMMVLTNTKNTK